MRFVFLLAVGAALATGFVACGDSDGPKSEAPQSALCGTTTISGATEPSSPQLSCADGPTSSAPGAQWGTLNGTLCLTTDIPAVALNGTQCTDPSTMTVVVHEAGEHFYTAELVDGSVTDPNTVNPFQPCDPTGAATIDVEPGGVDASDSTEFTISQKTADFVYGQDAQAPPICSVAISDGYHQQILVNIGIQISVNCANASCTGSASPSGSVWRRRD